MQKYQVKLLTIALSLSHYFKKLIEKKDVRGRTPLMLACTLGHFECAKLLMSKGANINIDADDGFNVCHEAIATNDPELVQLVLEKREFQRSSNRAKAIPALLRKIRDVSFYCFLSSLLKFRKFRISPQFESCQFYSCFFCVDLQTPDFYLEMRWEFTSWVPLLSKICPSDTYKIYKSNSSVRIDTTLSGFEQMSWQRGSRTYIFKASDECCRFLDINHDNRQVGTMDRIQIKADYQIRLSNPIKKSD